MGGPHVEISIDDPRADDVRALLRRHLALARLHSPPEDAHALEVDQLVEPGVTFFSAPARSLYASAGFSSCEPFGAYRASPNSVYMTLWLRSAG